MSYVPASNRYDIQQYRRSGVSGLQLPTISLGLWHNFGDVDRFSHCRDLILGAFDLGINHFDLANNYGPPPGSAEAVFGRILATDLRAHRDELTITTKAGWPMWSGPYGDGGSRKYLISSLDQSLKRMGLDYVDIFYHHRQDPNTPMEESLMALDFAVRSGRALYAGISSYSPENTRKAQAFMQKLGTPLIIHQPHYNMFDRSIENGLLDTLKDTDMGCIAFSPLAQGLLTDRYLGDGIPADSRAAKGMALKASDITQECLLSLRTLNEIAQKRGQKLSQMALAWVLRHPQMTSVVIGASRMSQIDDAIGALKNLEFSADELHAIDAAIALKTSKP